jgi:hypothetical protein
MPFTPLHFGPGLIIKAAVPSQFSLTAYTLANVAVDIEPLYHIARGDYPLHGPVHTLPLATLTGLLVGVGVSLLPNIFRTESLHRADGKYPDALRAEFRLPTSIIGGVLGGISHSLIDSLIYTDFHPFAPLSAQNPLHGLITPGDLSYGLFLVGVIGLVLLISRIFLIWRADK